MLERLWKEADYVAAKIKNFWSSKDERMTRPPFALGRSFVGKLRLKCKKRKNCILAGNSSGRWQKCDADCVAGRREDFMEVVFCFF